MPKIDGDLAEALRRLRDYFEQKQIPFALVGALVPALLLSSDVGTRETRDADHVIRLQSWAAWKDVIAELEHLGFTRGRSEQEHRLHYKTAEIDLIPFGIFDGPSDVLIWPKSGNRMNMTGFLEVFHFAKPTELAPGVTLPVVPLWLFVVLKIVAYLDREFPRDLHDLAYVLEHYETVGKSSRRFDLAGEVEGLTYETAGAFLLGRDIRLNVTVKAMELVKSFIAQISGEHHTVINVMLRAENRLFSDERRKALYQLIDSFRKGIA
ncbi:MAG: nucleotidyl transferase AbiEii/AbiGii toxin family protein [Nitrospira sp.]|nr:nucleotidyl transferase AbiEii/AbiGii toxin family protein [Nitrospira sp.]MCA9468567.1 nucleotidyl transferase AbiEii/AbiGii toxin family protein [Nitrospira sp.]